jgi:hypothetical protein
MAEPLYNLYYALDEKQWSLTAGGAAVSNPVDFIIRQDATFAIRFTTAGAVVELGTVTAWEFNIKRRDEFSAVDMVYTTTATKVGTGTATVYNFAPDCGGTELVAAMGAKRKVQCALQIDYTIGGVLNKTMPLEMDILNDYAEDSGPTIPVTDAFVRVNATTDVLTSPTAAELVAANPELGGGAGTVTSVSVVTANGISGTVATATTTPAITLTGGVDSNATFTADRTWSLGTSNTLTLTTASLNADNLLVLANSDGDWTGKFLSGTGTEAPFSIDYRGRLSCGNVTVSGSVYATGVSVNNVYLLGSTSGTATLRAPASAALIDLVLPQVGTDTLLSATSTATLTNKTISGASNTITNVSLTSGVTGTLPVANGGTGRTAALARFKVTKGGSDQTVTAGVSTKVTWSTEVWDVGGYFASDKWTPPAGKVRLYFQFYAYTLSFGSNFSAEIYKNGVQVGYVLSVAGSTSQQTQQITFEDDANGTDYYEAYANTQGATTWDGRAAYTFFQGEQLP